MNVFFTFIRIKSILEFHPFQKLKWTASKPLPTSRFNFSKSKIWKFKFSKMQKTGLLKIKESFRRNFSNSIDGKNLYIFLHCPRPKLNYRSRGYRHIDSTTWLLVTVQHKQLWFTDKYFFDFFNSFLAFAWNITRVRRIKQAHRFSYWNIILTIYNIWYMIWTIGYGSRAYAQGIENPTFGLGSLKYSATVKEFLRSKNHNFWFKSECHIVIL